MSDSETDRLRTAMKRISEGDWPRQRAKIYRQDGQFSKHDECPHGRRMWEDCDECLSAYARSVLSASQ